MNKFHQFLSILSFINDKVENLYKRTLYVLGLTIGVNLTRDYVPCIYTKPTSPLIEMENLHHGNEDPLLLDIFKGFNRVKIRSLDMIS